MSGRPIRALVLSLLVGGASLAAVVAWLGGDELRTLGTIRLGWLAAAAGALATSFVLAGVRLRMLVVRCGASLPLHHAVRAHVLGLFASSLTPGGSGGMPAVAMTLTRQGVPRAAAWSSMIGATVADTVLFGWSIPVALLVLYRGDALPSGPPFLIVSVLVSLVALAASYLLAFRLHWIRPLARVLLQGRLARLKPRLDRFLEDLLAAQGSLRRAPWSWHLRFHATVALSWWCVFAVLWACARGFGIGVPPWTVIAALTLVHGVGAFVPTPGGSGFFEFGGSLALLSVGARGGVAATVVVWRLLSHYVLFLLGPMMGGYLLLRPRGPATGPPVGEPPTTRGTAERRGGTER